MSDTAVFQALRRLPVGVAAIALLALCGCATDPVPAGYTGPLSHVSDTFTPAENGGVDFFYVAKINGATVDNALFSTMQANAGRGFAMSPVPFDRNVPAQTATFSIVGRTHYAAPIIELTHKVYQVSGDVSFAPAAGHNYLVKGVLSAAGSSVWIEDETGSVMDKKIELKDSALGILRK